MKKIIQETPCELCGMTIVRGLMAQAPEGYVCEDCIENMANTPLIEVDAKEAGDEDT